MKVKELLVTNVILDPTYKPKKLNLVGAMLRPVIGNRALPPRGTRVLTATDVTEAILLDLERGIDHGALRVRARVGPQKDLTVDEIRAFVGLPVLSAPVDSPVVPPLASVESSPEPTSLPEPPAEIVIPEEPIVEEAVAETAEEEPVVEEEVASTEEDTTPVATVDDLLEPEPAAAEKTVYDEAGLLDMKSDALSEILVAEFDYPADQLYKLKTKAAKVAEILARQGA